MDTLDFLYGLPRDPRRKHAQCIGVVIGLAGGQKTRIDNIRLDIVQEACPLLALAFESHQGGFVHHLEDYSKEAVVSFLRWTYTLDILSPTLVVGNVSLKVLLELYSLGENYDCTPLADCAMAALSGVIEDGTTSIDPPVDLIPALEYLHTTLECQDPVYSTILGYCATFISKHGLLNKRLFLAFLKSHMKVLQDLAGICAHRKQEKEALALLKLGGIACDLEDIANVGHLSSDASFLPPLGQTADQINAASGFHKQRVDALRGFKEQAIIIQDCNWRPSKKRHATHTGWDRDIDWDLPDTKTFKAAAPPTKNDPLPPRRLQEAKEDAVEALSVQRRDLTVFPDPWWSKTDVQGSSNSSITEMLPEYQEKFEQSAESEVSFPRVSVPSPKSTASALAAGLQKSQETTTAKPTPVHTIHSADASVVTPKCADAAALPSSASNHKGRAPAPPSTPQHNTEQDWDILSSPASSDWSAVGQLTPDELDDDGFVLAGGVDDDVDLPLRFKHTNATTCDETIGNSEMEEILSCG